MDLIIVNDEARIKTSWVADKFKRRHEAVLRLVRKYQDAFDELGGMITAPKRHGKGRPRQGYLLNYGQAMFLCSVLKNTPQALYLKKTFSQAFNSGNDLISKVKAAFSGFDFDDIDCRYVYAAQDQDGNLKIGISNNPDRRIRELNIGNAQELRLVYINEAQNPRYQDESELHKAAAPYLISGEWFTQEARRVLIEQ